MSDQKTPGVMRYAGLATQWMVMMLLAVWLGYKLDKKLNWTVPVFVILFPLISLGVSLWQLMRELNNKKNE
jgi:F0F1-type ATP synthase assembly protein I